MALSSAGRKSTHRHIIAALLVFCAPVVSSAQDIKVTLLGTGAPPAEIDRFGPSTLVEAGGELLLFDVGRGVTQRLSQLKINPPDLDALFLTHLHADHTVGMPDLWLVSALGNRRAGFRIFGPEGTEAMMLNLRRAFDADSRIAAAADATPTTQIAEGVVYTQNRVTVTAFRVDHAQSNSLQMLFRTLIIS